MILEGAALGPRVGNGTPAQDFGSAAARTTTTTATQVLVVVHCGVAIQRQLAANDGAVDV